MNLMLASKASKRELVAALDRVISLQTAEDVVDTVLDAVPRLTNAVDGVLTSTPPARWERRTRRVRYYPLTHARSMDPLAHEEDGVAPAAIDVPASRRRGDPKGAPRRMPLWLRVELRPYVVRLRIFEHDDLEALTRSCATALDRIHEREAVTWTADHDALTGLLNRGGFWRSAVPTMQEAQPLSLVLLDLDGFKQANDTYGHDRGDQLLVACADRLRDTVPPDTHIVRWGGDEFVIALPGRLEDSTLVELGHRLVEAVRSAGDAVVAPGSVAASVGIATRSPRHSASAGTPAESVDQLLERADAAMYDAKSAGKATVRVAVRTGRR